ncbi:hypothetical protein D3C80_1817350 [compost metagenome]
MDLPPLTDNVAIAMQVWIKFQVEFPESCALYVGAMVLQFRQRVFQLANARGDRSEERVNSLGERQVLVVTGNYVIIHIQAIF